MIYSWTSYESVVSVLENTYHIKTNDYIYRLPVWINEALSELRIKLPCEPKVTEVTVKDHKIPIPKSARSIALVTYNGAPVHRENTVTKIGNISTGDFQEYYYTMLQLLHLQLMKHLLYCLIDILYVILHQELLLK